MKIDEKYIPKIVLKTKYGSFELGLVAFCRTKTSGHFMFNINQMLSDLFDVSPLMCVKDIRISNETWEYRTTHIENVLKTLRNSMLYDKRRNVSLV